MRNAERSACGPDWRFRTSQSAIHLARIEVGPSEIRKLLENGLSLKVAEALKRIGYVHVTLDLQGYRRGSVNEVLPSADSRQPGPHSS